ncbi:hypothetical protein ANN_12458 [Periplaneta americana]|uniref:Uncharacterized protein n=1 Tax=Periplaneta americana TaxID=6978 RepID=A0ABQ8TIR2_PERAM|nr:hypothetical protein ANN_12458 [Periplaneta americana]
MAGLCEDGNEPPGSLKASFINSPPELEKCHKIAGSSELGCDVKAQGELAGISLMLAGSDFQSLGRAIVKEDEYEEVRWDGIVSIVS